MELAHFILRRWTLGRWTLGRWPRGRWRHAVFGLEYVLNIALQDQKIGCRPAIDLQRAAIVPLNRAFNLFAVQQHENHLRVRVDLFLVIVDLGVCLSRRRLALPYLDG